MDVIDLIVCARAAAHRLNGRYPAGAAGPGSGLAAPAMTDGVSAGGLPAGGPAESGDGFGILLGGIQARCAPPQISCARSSE